MRLKYVTFTGADDNTDPEKMLEVSKEYHQVEWGILMSPSRATDKTGSPRFPSHKWIHQIRYVFHGVPANFSGHLCGKHVRDLIAGDFLTGSVKLDDQRLFQRFQINFHGNRIPENNQLETVLRNYHDQHQFIVQMDGKNDSVYTSLRERAIKVFPLFDQSGGEGLLPKTWETPLGDFCGYAGGLSPDNLKGQLALISEESRQPGNLDRF